MSGAREPRIRTPRSRTGIAGVAGRNARGRGRVPLFGGRAAVLGAIVLLPIAGRDCRRTDSKPVVAARPATVPVAAAPSATAKPDLFLTSVRPVLSARCTPCHEPGGKMYERLPFDRAEVVAEHRDGVLRRIKQTDEREAILKWLASVDAASGTQNR